jgi:hypothetical protein
MSKGKSELRQVIQRADLDRHYIEERVAQAIKTRDALRAALVAANASDVYAAQDGIYGLIHDALEIIEPGCVEAHANNGEWPS